MYEIIFTDKFKKEFKKLSKGGQNYISKVKELIKEIKGTPTEGKGMPERLKHELNNFYSRRIINQHRLIYEINEEENKVTLLRCYGHYDDK